MTFSFATLLESIESLFKVAATEPAVLKTAADTVVTAAAPVIDQIGGAGTAAKVTAQVDSTAQQVTDFLAPHLAQAEMAEQVAHGVTAILTANAAQAAASGTVSPVSPTPVAVTSGGTATPAG
jgi:hypothetical protein